MATGARVILAGALVAIALAAIAAFLLNVPPLAIAAGAIVALISLFVLLSRHAAGQRSGRSLGSSDSRSR
ncbi:MAG: hypothetical protein MNPFHGCM_01489 [Gemmatimonadaceae bacterium]|nr:hypothetical protein [Gemmatimonadaceae bacterium]